MSTTILSIILGIGGMFGWGIYDFLGGVFSKQIGSFKSLFWSQLAGLVAILLLAFAFKTEISIPVPAIILSPIASALSIVTIALAVIFLKDKVSKLQGFGIVMAIVGIIATAF